MIAHHYCLILDFGVLYCLNLTSWNTNDIFENKTILSLQLKIFFFKSSIKRNYGIRLWDFIAVVYHKSYQVERIHIRDRKNKTGEV